MCEKASRAKGSYWKTLTKIAEPDIIKKYEKFSIGVIEGKYIKKGFETRQVIDLKISIDVTEYRAEVLKGPDGKKYVVKFPKGIDRPIQYGNHAKTHAVYQPQYEMISYQRVELTSL